jgi:PAB1-binding protein PBP1
LGEWVRISLRKSLTGRSITSGEEKIKAIKKLSQSNRFPSGDIEKILLEIEKGRS